MTKIIIFRLLLAFTFVSFNNAKAQTGKIRSCYELKAVLLGDSTVKKLKYDLGKLERTIKESDSLYVINYVPKSEGPNSGGVDIYIIKCDCRIVKKMRYQ